MAQIYEVTVRYAGDDPSEFETYMADTHIPDVLATDCFAAAFFAKEGDSYVVGYHVNTPENMQRYLDQFAPALRDDVMTRYDGKVEISRRMLDIVKLFPGQE